MTEPRPGNGPDHLPSDEERRAFADACGALARGIGSTAKPTAEALGIAGANVLSVMLRGGLRHRRSPESPGRGASDARWATWRHQRDWTEQQNLASLRALIGAARMLADAGADAGVEQIRAHVWQQWRVRLETLPTLGGVEAAAREVLGAVPGYQRRVA